MRESVNLTVADAIPSQVQSVDARDARTRERIVVDQNAVTGTRLKYYMRSVRVSPGWRKSMAVMD